MIAEELHCSPVAYKRAETNNTCFNHNELKLLAKEFNKHSDKKIKLSSSKNLLVKDLEESYKHICDKKQFCWISQHLSNTSKQEKLFTNFRPSKPKSWYSNKNTWLNTYNLLYVMQQYELLYKDFEFMGVHPIDFAEKDTYGNCIGDLLCDIDIKHFSSNKKTRFAIILNLDTSNGPGTHWCGVYCNMNKKKPNYGIYYYDSVGEPYKDRVKRFFNNIKTQVNDPDFEVRYNNIQAQFGNNECGMFSMVFVTQCLKHVPFNDICKGMKGDAYMNELRNLLYRP